MNKSAPIGLTLLFALTASAQNVLQMETSLGYSYVRFTSATNVPAFSANGGSGQFVYNFNKWIGAVADLGAVHNGNINSLGLDSTFANFLFGPRLALHKGSQLSPYVQVLWGEVYGTSSTRVELLLTPSASQPIFLPGQDDRTNLSQAISARINTSQTALAMTAGGGLDIKINKHMSLRPIEVDYYLTRLQNSAGRHTTIIKTTCGTQRVSTSPLAQSKKRRS